MSRETNSLLLRYGINIFWSSSLFFPQNFFLTLQLNSFFGLVLRNYFFSTLKIQYISNFIILYVFYYKEERFSFIFKFLKLANIQVTKLVLRKNYSLKFSTGKPITNLDALSFIFIGFIRKLFLSFLFYQLLVKFQLFFPIKSLVSVCVRDTIGFLVKLRTSQIFFFRNWKLQVINFLLKFKWLCLFISSLIFDYTNKKINVVLKSILEHSFVTLRIPFFFKYLRNGVTKQKFYLVLLSFFFFKAKILTSYLALLVKKTKNKKHIKNLIFFFHSLRTLFVKQFICIYGLKFKISGRLGGKLRRSSFGYKLGYSPLMSFKTYVDYSCDFVYTQYGSFSLKLWFCEKNEQTSIL